MVCISFCGKKPWCVCIPLTGHGSKLVHKMLFESWVYYNRYNTAGKIFKTPCLKDPNTSCDQFTVYCYFYFGCIL